LDLLKIPFEQSHPGIGQEEFVFLAGVLPSAKAKHLVEGQDSMDVKHILTPPPPPPNREMVEGRKGSKSSRNTGFFLPKDGLLAEWVMEKFWTFFEMLLTVATGR
jgi:hypothetical protein